MQQVRNNICVCTYHHNWYFGVANYVSVENVDVNVRFLDPKGPSVQFSWPNRFLVPIHDIITKVEPPSCGSTGRMYGFNIDKSRFGKQLSSLFYLDA